MLARKCELGFDFQIRLARPLFAVAEQGDSGIVGEGVISEKLKGESGRKWIFCARKRVWKLGGRQRVRISNFRRREESKSWESTEISVLSRKRRVRSDVTAFKGYLQE